jgi:hemin uptake protein HemP
LGDQISNPPDSTRPAAGPRRSVASAELFDGGSELLIRHGAEEYRLRITRQGKLILTK